MNINLKSIGNILMVSNYPSDTSYAWWLMENFWITMSQRSRRMGGKAYLAYPKITCLSQEIDDSPAIPVELHIPWNNVEEKEKVKRFIIKNNITILYFTDKPYFSFLYIRLRLWGVRNIIIHDHTPGDRLPVGGLRGALKATRNKISWPTADYILCVSKLMRQRNIATARLPANKCIVVQNGIKPVVCARINNAALRESLDLRSKSILVVTTGRAHPYKRFDFIIRCAEIINNKAPDLDVIFLLVGDGPNMPELCEMVKRLNLERIVLLLGFRNDVRDLLCISDIALHAALGEGFSLSIIEYMSAGLPVLVPDIPSVCQATKHDDTGIIYPKDDAEIVVSHLLTLAKDTKRRLRMGASAKTVANYKYNLNKCTNEFISVIDSIFSNMEIKLRFTRD